MTMYAVIRTGGKQYRVAADDVFDVERLSGEVGDTLEFADVLMMGGGEGDPQIGAPLVAGALVAAEVVEHHRGKKIIIFKKRRRTTYRRKQGHRQELTTIRITEILADGEKPKKQAKSNPAAPAGARGEGDTAPQPMAKAKSAKTES